MFEHSLLVGAGLALLGMYAANRAVNTLVAEGKMPERGAVPALVMCFLFSPVLGIVALFGMVEAIYFRVRSKIWRRYALWNLKKIEKRMKQLSETKYKPKEEE